MTTQPAPNTPTTTKQQAPGEHSLKTLLATLRPRLDRSPYTYASLPANTPLPPRIAALLKATPPPAPPSDSAGPAASAAASPPAVGVFFEPHRRAWTLILPADVADDIFPPSRNSLAGGRGVADAHADTDTDTNANADANGSSTITTTAEAGNAAIRASFWPCALITLDVHSSLEGVGFMAAVAAALAGAGIGCNPLAGWWSDHLFVAAGDAERAVAVLEGLREGGPG